MTCCILGSSLEDLRKYMKELGQPSFRADQLVQWLWHICEYDPVRMTNMPKPLRDILGASHIVPMECVSEVTSSDGETTKYVWKLSDGFHIESVLIRAPGRRTVCVSSQVGCPARCAFCASGRQGLFRNLSVAEIVYQVLYIQKQLLTLGERVSHIVYMGMGEPLTSCDAVFSSIRLLTDEQLLGLSKRRITLSTVGVVEGIHALKNSGLGINLALSLHAPTQSLRQSIMPITRQYALKDVLQAVEAYQKATGRDITYEYILLSGVNDSQNHARELVSLLSGSHCTVNVIPYNPVEGVSFTTPSHEVITGFCRYLERAGIPVTCRYKKGGDIAAACGQLAGLNNVRE